MTRLASISLTALSLMVLGCRETSEQKADTEKIFILEESINNVETLLGQPLTIQEGEPEVRMYHYRDFSISISYTNQTSSKFEFKITTENEEEDINLGSEQLSSIYDLLGVSSENMEGLLSFGKSSLKRFKSPQSESDHLFAINQPQKSVKVEPLDKESFDGLKRYIGIQ